MHSSRGVLALVAAEPERPAMCQTCQAHLTSICRALPDREHHRISEHAIVREFATGDVLAREGEPARYVTTITSGTVMLSRLLADGRRQVLGFLLRGDFLGLQDTPDYPFTVEAIGRVSVCRYPNPQFRRLLGEFPDLERELLSRASDELGCARRHIVLLGRKTARERLATFLLDLAEREGKRGGAPGLVALPMTRTDIADYLGLTTETVSRVFSALKRSGAIQLLPHAMVRLVRPSELERMAESA